MREQIAVNEMDTVPGKILLLEDDLGLLELTQRRLEKLGHKVQPFSTRDMLMKHADFSQVDILITDYRLDHRSTGLDTYAEIQALGHALPAILVTGFGDEDVLLQAMRMGVRDFVPKNANYLESLAIVTDRVIAAARREAELQQARHEKHIRRQIEGALEAANIGYWVIPIEEGELVWPVQMQPGEPAVPDADVAPVSSLREAWAIVDPADRFGVLRLIARSIRARRPFEVEFRTSAAFGKRRWLRVKGTAEYRLGRKVPSRLTGTVWDESRKREDAERIALSYREIESLAGRLKLNMMETHHRVKNSFQIVRSLLNMELREKSVLQKESVDKVMAHIHGLSLIHDILTDRMKLDPSSSHIAGDMLVQRLIDNFAIVNSRQPITSKIAEFAVSPRVGSTLAVVITELIINALKHGTSFVEVFIECLEDDRASLRVTNGIMNETESKSSDPGRTSTGSQLVKFLSRSDFGSEVVVEVDSERHSVSVSFPIERCLD